MYEEQKKEVSLMFIYVIYVKQMIIFLKPHRISR